MLTGGCRCQDGSHQLNVASERTYQVLRNLYEELDSLFPDVPFHLGGSNIKPKCWEDTASGSDFWATHSLDELSSRAMVNFFYNETLSILSDLGREAIVWYELLR